MWYHECDREWLEERRKYLTASTIAKLVPLTATGKLRNTTEAEIAIFANNNAEVTDEEVKSFGAAARGHLLEPYAIAAFNVMQEGTGPYLFHWDDALIHDSHLAFSPDAMSIFRPNEKISYSPDELHSPSTNVILGEVKCYAPLGHYRAGIATLKERLEERWQIATAMAVDISIQEAYLILFNPSCKHSLFIRHWMRDELADEINDVYVASASYQKVKKTYAKLADELVVDNKEFPLTEEGIIQELTSKSILNPEEN